MKRKHTKTLEAIMQADGNVDMRNVEALVVAVGGYIEDRGNGFYRARLNERRMTYDRPHPRSEIGRGLAKRFRDFFKEAGVE